MEQVCTPSFSHAGTNHNAANTNLRSLKQREIFKLKDDNHQYCLEKRELRENDELLDFPAPPQDHRVEEGFFWSSKLYPARS